MILLFVFCITLGFFGAVAFLLENLTTGYTLSIFQYLLATYLEILSIILIVFALTMLVVSLRVFYLFLLERRNISVITKNLLGFKLTQSMIAMNICLLFSSICLIYYGITWFTSIDVFTIQFFHVVDIIFIIILTFLYIIFHLTMFKKSHFNCLKK